MDYKEQIKSPKWQKKRLEILNRDDFTCQICGAKDHTLHVHHLSYVQGKEIWDYPSENLITLCEFCHDTEHELKSTFYNIVCILNSMGVTCHELIHLLYCVYKEIDGGNQYVINDMTKNISYFESINLLAARRSK